MRRRTSVRRRPAPAEGDWADQILKRLASAREHPVRWGLALGVAAAVAVAAGWLNAVGSNLAPGGDPPPRPAEIERPFSVAVTTDAGEGGRYALPRALRNPQVAAGILDGSFDGLGVAEYVHRGGGAGVGTVYSNLVLTGPSSESMRVTRVAVHRYPALPVLDGTIVNTPSAGDVAAIPLTIDLDRPGEEFLGEDGRPHFRDRAVELAAGEHVTLAMTVTGTRAYYRWVLRIDYVDARGRATSVLAGRDGKLYPTPQSVPASSYFALTGKATHYAVTYESLFPAEGYQAD